MLRKTVKAFCRYSYNLFIKNSWHNEKWRMFCSLKNSFSNLNFYTLRPSHFWQNAFEVPIYLSIMGNCGILIFHAYQIINTSNTLHYKLSSHPSLIIFCLRECSVQLIFACCRRMSGNSLVMVPIEGLSSLRDKFRVGWPKHILAFTFFENIIKSRGSNPEKDDEWKILCLNGDWSNGTFVAILVRIALFSFCTTTIFLARERHFLRISRAKLHKSQKNSPTCWLYFDENVLVCTGVLLQCSIRSHWI